MWKRLSKDTQWMCVSFAAFNYFACISLAAGVLAAITETEALVTVTIGGLVGISVCFTLTVAFGLRYYLGERSVQ